MVLKDISDNVGTSSGGLKIQLRKSKVSVLDDVLTLCIISTKLCYLVQYELYELSPSKKIWSTARAAKTYFD